MLDTFMCEGPLGFLEPPIFYPNLGLARRPGVAWGGGEELGVEALGDACDQDLLEESGGVDLQ